MSDHCTQSVNLNWWQEAKAASLDRKKKQTALTALARPGDTFLIVTEGTVTEPIYFDLLLKNLQLSLMNFNLELI